MRIGYDQAVCERKHLPDTQQCDGSVSSSLIPGMKWCKTCKADSCPLVSMDRAFLSDPEFPRSNFQCIGQTQTINGSSWCHSCDVNLRLCSWDERSKLKSPNCIDARMGKNGKILCRNCVMSMALGSSSLTMVELSRAYSTFATYGKIIEPYFIENVKDRNGSILKVINLFSPNRSFHQMLLRLPIGY